MAVQNQVKSLLSNKPDKILLDSLKMLDAKVVNEHDKIKAADFRVARAWVVDELESRFPVINEAIEEWILDIHDSGKSYFDVVVEVVENALKEGK